MSVHHGLRSILMVALAASTLSACAIGGGDGPATPALAGPTTVVVDAVAKAQARDITGLRSISCASQEATIQSLVGLAGVGSDLLPGIDLQTVINAITVDTSGVKVGDAAITGDEAEVRVTGSVKVTFIATSIRPILEKLMTARGTPMSSDQLDALVQGLQDYGQDVPLNQQVRVVRESGVWKVCRKDLGPAPTVSAPTS